MELKPPSRPSRIRALRSAGMIACGLVLCLLQPGARAQGRGIVAGRLVNKTNPSILASGVELDVVGLGGGMSIMKSAKTDATGNFKLDGLPTDSPLMIRANYRDVHYHGRVSFDASGKAFVEIPVYEPTNSLAGIRLESVRFAFQLSGDRLRNVELYSVSNETTPPRSYMNIPGSFRFAKAPGITEPPKLSVTGPGSEMPLIQPPLESTDGQSYYSLYPLRPGITLFEVDQQLPYKGRTYRFRRKFYYEVDSYEIGVIPKDMAVSGSGLSRLQTDARRNFTVYRGGPVKAGTEVDWTISGGTPEAEPMPSEFQGEARIKNNPTMIAQNALILGPLMLIGLVVVLWYAVRRMPEDGTYGRESRTQELKLRRDQLMNHIASLDNRHANDASNRREYVRQREQSKRQLRRITVLLKK